MLWESLPWTWRITVACGWLILFFYWIKFCIWIIRGIRNDLRRFLNERRKRRLDFAVPRPRLRVPIEKPRR